MIVRVIEPEKHDNFYEGERVGFHNVVEDETAKKFIAMVVESAKDSVTVDYEVGSGIKAYVMNDAGKTIETKYF